jgi:signal transduction histidine kinase
VHTGAEKSPDAENDAHDRRKLSRRFSLVTRGTRIQFVTAFAMTAVIPLLILALLFLGDDTTALFRLPRRTLVAAMVVIMALGHALMFRYPLTIMQIRRYLNNLMRGDMPDHVNFMKDESDIRAIEEGFNLLLTRLRDQLDAAQREKRYLEQLVEAERHRVMIESLGAACHHLGQPATVILTYLELMKRRRPENNNDEMLENCIHAARAIADVLDTLQRFSKYRTEPYLPSDGERPDAPAFDHIVRVPAPAAAGSAA